MKLLQTDISENEILEQSPELLSMLLVDRTLSTGNSQVNIFWATNIMPTWELVINMKTQLQ